MAKLLNAPLFVMNAGPITRAGRAMQRLSGLEYHYRGAPCRIANGGAQRATQRLRRKCGRCKVQKLSDISLEELPRFSTGFKEFDRVLGGGVVPGSAILIGGNPARANQRCCCKRCAGSPSR